MSAQKKLSLISSRITSLSHLEKSAASRSYYTTAQEFKAEKARLLKEKREIENQLNTQAA